MPSPAGLRPKTRTTNQRQNCSNFVDFLAARDGDGQASRLMARVSEAAFGAVWDNTEDAEYDRL